MTFQEKEERAGSVLLISIRIGKLERGCLGLLVALVRCYVFLEIRRKCFLKVLDGNEVFLKR